MLKRKISSYFTPDDATEKSKKSCGTEMEKWRKSYNAWLKKERLKMGERVSCSTENRIS